MFLKGAVFGVDDCRRPDAFMQPPSRSDIVLYCVLISLPRSDLKPMALRDGITARVQL